MVLCWYSVFSILKRYPLSAIRDRPLPINLHKLHCQLYHIAMFPSVLAQGYRRGLVATVSCSKRPSSIIDAHQTYQARRSTGISYLDTWMGNQKRRPLAPAAAAAVSVTKNSAPNGINFAVAQANKTTAVANTGNHQPISSYQLYNLRAARNVDPKTLIDTFNKSLHSNSGISSNIPIVLDMTAFHPDGSPHYTPPVQGTLTTYVNAIQSTSNLSLVGVTNLPPPERKGQLSTMTIEAQSLNLPVMQSTTNTSFAPEMKSNASSTSQIPIRKKRGGVAPLLRPRRPVAGKTVTELNAADVDTAKEFAKGPIQHAAATQITESYPSTKVHKGSIRSGQLITSDLPNQSLVVIGSINPGGEVWSEGDVFVYGKLRGRVLAGLRNVGDKPESVGGKPIVSDAIKKNSDPNHHKLGQSSRIFATSFDPELVCIGDTFTTIDDVNTLGLDGVGPAIVTLNDDGELSFERFDL